MGGLRRLRVRLWGDWRAGAPGRARVVWCWKDKAAGCRNGGGVAPPGFGRAAAQRVAAAAAGAHGAAAR